MSTDALSNILSLICGITFIVIVSVVYIWAAKKRYGHKVRSQRYSPLCSGPEILIVESPESSAMHKLLREVEFRELIGNDDSQLIEKRVENVNAELQLGNQNPEWEEEQIGAQTARLKPKGKRKSKRGRRRKKSDITHLQSLS